MPSFTLASLRFAVLAAALSIFGLSAITGCGRTIGFDDVGGGGAGGGVGGGTGGIGGNPSCGNGKCSGSETCSTCQADGGFHQGWGAGSWWAARGRYRYGAESIVVGPALG